MDVSGCPLVIFGLSEVSLLIAKIPAATCQEATFEFLWFSQLLIIPRGFIKLAGLIFQKLSMLLD